VSVPLVLHVLAPRHFALTVGLLSVPKTCYLEAALSPIHSHCICKQPLLTLGVYRCHYGNTDTCSDGIIHHLLTNNHAWLNLEDGSAVAGRSAHLGRW